MKISKRAIRRHHYQRLKKKQEYRHYWKYVLSGMDKISFPEKQLAKWQNERN